jgi:hypothetical protein
MDSGSCLLVPRHGVHVGPRELWNTSADGPWVSTGDPGISVSLGTAPYEENSGSCLKLSVFFTCAAVLFSWSAIHCNYRSPSSDLIHSE